jgi:hypothetical protein
MNIICNGGTQACFIPRDNMNLQVSTDSAFPNGNADGLCWKMLLNLDCFRHISQTFFCETSLK